METAFLRAIIENPDDLAPRLIYADWLDEHGDADQAEFIRFQCARGMEADALPRETELLDRRWREWSQPILSLIPHLARNGISFQHGFPFRLTFRSAGDLEHLPAIMNVAPIREMDLDFDGNESALPHRRWHDIFFIDDTLTGLPPVRRLRIRSEQEQRRLDKIFEALLHGMEI